ncbi:hypothetical protein [Actinomadura welshii]|uniref:hypothetical protein n=1 Tax=Actinomadura welshii TaxID=3103817 RepID=UPI00190F9FB1|nr:hypothetical protein [Actinomadura madurae]
MAFMDQAPALAGVIIGALGSYLTSSLTERARWRRTRTERWDEKKFEIYANYANALKTQIGIGQRIAAHRGLAYTVDPLEPEEGMRLLAQAESRRQAEWEAVLLVGDAETVAAARAWHEGVWNIGLWVRGLKDDQEGWVAAVQRVSRARDDFYSCARRDLGIAGPPPPSGPWPRNWQQDEPDDAIEFD